MYMFGIFNNGNHLEINKKVVWLMTKLFYVVNVISDVVNIIRNVIKITPFKDICERHS